MVPDAFVCVIEARIHVEDSGSLKSKRKVVRSLKDGLRNRFGAAVAEIDGQDTWQRSVLLVSLVGGPEAEITERADRVQEYIASRVEDRATFERHLRSLEDLA